MRDPRLLLDACRDEHRLSEHTIIQGHVAARSGDALARLVGERLKAQSPQHAATALAAAWQLTHLATFRVATFYVAAEPDAVLMDELAFREDAPQADVVGFAKALLNASTGTHDAVVAVTVVATG